MKEEIKNLLESSNLEDVILGIRMIYQKEGKKGLAKLNEFKHNLDGEIIGNFDYILFKGCMIFFDSEELNYRHCSEQEFKEWKRNFNKFIKY